MKGISAKESFRQWLDNWLTEHHIDRRGIWDSTMEDIIDDIVAQKRMAPNIRALLRTVVRRALDDLSIKPRTKHRTQEQVFVDWKQLPLREFMSEVAAEIHLGILDLEAAERRIYAYVQLHPQHEINVVDTVQKLREAVRILQSITAA